jgi:hypothetical protein
MRVFKAMASWKVLAIPLILAGCSTAPKAPEVEVVAEDTSGFRDPAFFFKKKDIRRNDLCVCMIGAYPTNQQKFFKLGCSLWFTQQSCEAKRRIVEEGDPSFADALSTTPHGSKVVLGFVGHWGSAGQTVDWLKKDILPVASEREIDLRVDNTACSGGDDPTRLREGTAQLLRELPVPNLEVKVNQEVSSGMWDPYLPGKNNFWVEYRNQGGSDGLRFPECRSFEKRSCWGWMQGGGSGFCEEEENGVRIPRLLVCSQVERDYYAQAPGAPAHQLERRKRRVYEWIRMDVKKPSFEVVENKGYRPPVLTIGLKNNRFYDARLELDQDPDQRESSEAYYLFLKRKYLEELPEQVHVDTGDESLDEKTIERSLFSVDDIEIKEQKPGYFVKRFELRVKVLQDSGKLLPKVWGVYSTKDEALAVRNRILKDPLILKADRYR